MRLPASLAALLLALLLHVAVAAETFLGPIPVQFVARGSELVLDMHRFYEPAAAPQLAIKSGKGVDARFDAKSMELRLRVAPTAKGLIELPFNVDNGGASGVLTLLVRQQLQHTFRFRGDAATKQVSLVGAFNNWDAKKHPLTRGKDGHFTTTLQLEPGTYTYKFIVDGKWISDAGNPLDSPDGFGGKNSLLTIGDAEKGGGLAIFAAHLGDETLTIGSTGPIAAYSAVAHLPNGSTRPVTAKVNDRGLTCEIAELPAGSSVRVVAVNATGAASNVVLVPIGDAPAPRWQDAVMYYAFTDRFADGDPANNKPVDHPEVLPPANYHGGDWRGIIDKINDGYFERLGVNTLWLAPLNQNPAGAFQESPAPHRWYTGYHGYWPISPTEVEPRFGDAETLKELVRAAHARGIRVIADLVLNHVHIEHPWWREHRDWFGQLELPDGTLNLRKWDEHQFTTWFEPFLPSFDFENSEAVDALIENSIWWANEYNLDGFRLDAVKHIPQQFWRKLRVALRERVEKPRGRTLYLVGETFQDRRGIASFVGPNMLDGQFDFPLYDSIKDAFASEKIGLDAVESSLAASEAVFGKEALMSPLIGNHDKARFMAYADGDLPDPKHPKEEEVGWHNPPQVDNAESYDKIKLAAALLLSLDGVPMIYYGDEIGMTGAGDPDNRRPMRFGDDVAPAEREVLTHFEQLAKVRREHPALRYGSRRALAAEKELLVFVRAYLEDRVVCVFNRSAKPVESSMPAGPELENGDYRDELGRSSAVVSEGELRIEVPARSAAFFVRAQ
jgi:cyclomaltodextrinase / maltogenic alpha-amylase / neopullulanase